MQNIMSFIFNNIFLIIIAFVIYYVYTQYKELKEKIATINELFDRILNKYVVSKITNAKNLAEKIISEHGDNELIKGEAERLLIPIKDSLEGTINDKVEASNAINRFTLSKKIDTEKYPYMLQFNDIGVFTDEDMNSLENGLAIARREYNANAFRYNEKVSSTLMQYFAKSLRLVPHFAIFGEPKSSHYEENFEVFEEVEPEINSLASLNLTAEEIERDEAEKKLQEEQNTKSHEEKAQGTDEVNLSSTNDKDNT